MSDTNIFKWLLACCVFMLLTACGNDHDIRARIDGDWHRQTLEKDHLEHWLKVLPTANGFFNTAVSRDWQVLDPQPGDIVSHTRAIYQNRGQTTVFALPHRPSRSSRKPDSARQTAGYSRRDGIRTLGEDEPVSNNSALPGAGAGRKAP